MKFSKQDFSCGDAEQFPDAAWDHPYADAILSGRAWGWLEGLPDGSFGPEDTLHRSEAVTIINRALGRTGDRASIAENRPAPKHMSTMCCEIQHKQV